MARFTTIAALGKSYFLKLFPDVTRAFGGDNCCSAIISILDFLKASQVEKAGPFASDVPNRTPVSVTMAQVQWMVDGLYSVRSIQERLEFLCYHGVLSQPEGQKLYTKNLNLPLVFTLDSDRISSMIWKAETLVYVPVKNFTGIVPEQVPSEGTKTVFSEKDPPDFGEKTTPEMPFSGVHKSVGTLEKKIQNQEECAGPPSEQSQNPTPPADEGIPDQSDLSLDGLIEQMSFARRNTKAGRIKGADEAALRERLPALMRDYSPTAILEGWQKYLQSEHWAKRKLPTSVFCTRLSQYVPYSARGTGRPTSRVIPVAPPAPPPPSPIQPEPSNAKGIPFAAHEWNRVVTLGPAVESWTNRDTCYAKAVADPEFIDALPKVLEICKKAFEVKPQDVSWLNFRWLLRQDKVSGIENWYRVSTGEFNWITTDREHKPQAKARGTVAVDNLLAKLQAQIKTQEGVA